MGSENNRNVGQVGWHCFQDGEEFLVVGDLVQRGSMDKLLAYGDRNGRVTFHYQILKVTIIGKSKTFQKGRMLNPIIRIMTQMVKNDIKDTTRRVTEGTSTIHWSRITFRCFVKV